jgi:hypothetical protein
MKRKLFTAALVLFLFSQASGQDYFEDIKGEGVPVLLNGNENKWLFVSRLNIGDNSGKLNLYRFWKVDEEGFDKPNQDRHKLFLGAGIFGKAKTENGIGSLFGSGHLAGGFSAGAYFVVGKRIWDVNGAATRYGTWNLIFSGSLSGSEFQLYDTSRTIFTEHLKEKTFTGGKGAVSFVRKTFQNSNNIYLGLSLGCSKINNYKKLDKVNIKNDSIYTSGGIVRTVTVVNDNGNTYGIGPYKEFGNLNLRFNLTYVPGFLDNQVGFVFYPSVDISKDYSPRYNLGFAVNLLKDGNPSVSKVALLFELNDLNNEYESSKPFIKRSFSVGIATSFNIITGGKE